MPATDAADVVILGAGAAGMMCAAEAVRTGRRVVVLDHASAPGEKIRISGGGRCNFTNLGCAPEHFLSENPRFCRSALARYTPRDFLALVGRHGIPWHEKAAGQLFCDRSAKDIIAMLRAEMGPAELRLGTGVAEIAHDGAFRLRLSDGSALACARLVVATGGKSIPKMGATGFGYRVAEQFGLRVTETRPGLVPLTFGPEFLGEFAPLAGVSCPAAVASGAGRFEEALLFTHRGLSGPAILQVSSYWREGRAVTVDLLPGQDAAGLLRERRAAEGRRPAASVLADWLPKRLAGVMAARLGLAGNLADLSNARVAALGAALNGWEVMPVGSEGYRTAEVTLGGVDTAELDARTFEAKQVPGLHFIGEVVDVTGWLGGYNFQWAWASAVACGRALAAG